MVSGGRILKENQRNRYGLMGIGDFGGCSVVSGKVNFMEDQSKE